MQFLEQIAGIPWPDWLVILLPCFIIFGLVFWRSQSLRVKGADPRTWSETVGWRAKAAYLGRLAGFGLVSFLTVAITLTIYQNIKMVQAHIAPATSQFDPPPAYPHRLQTVSFHTNDGLRLQGWLIEPSKPATIILLHGYGSDRRSMLWHADQLAQYGLGVLLYDERASGMSEGDRRSYGWQDPADVSAALDFLASHPMIEDSSYGVAGCSIGGQIAIQAAAHDTRIGAVWADGPAIVRAADLPAPHNWITTLSSISSHVTDWTFAAHLRRLPPPALVDQLPAISPRPVQLVAGGTGVNAMGPEARLTEHFERHAGPQTDLWIIESAVHCDGPVVAPTTYSIRLVDFFSEALLK